MNNIETVNLMLAFEDFKNNYNKYKELKELSPRFYVSQLRHITEDSNDILKKFREDLSSDLLSIKSQAIELEKLGLKSQLIDEVKAI